MPASYNCRRAVVLMLIRERKDLICAHRDVAGKHTVFIDEVPDRRREYSILLRELPFILHHDWKFESELLGFAAVFVGVAASDHHHREIVVSMFAIHTNELGCHVVARAAVGSAEDEQHATTAILFE